jgi:hypothetical protein
MSRSAAAASSAVRVESAGTTERTTVAAGSPMRLPSCGVETTFAGAALFFSMCAGRVLDRCAFGGGTALAAGAARDALEPELAAGREAAGVEVAVLVGTGAVTTGVGTACGVGCDDALARGLGAVVAAVGASGVGASDCERPVRDELEDSPDGACDRLVREALDPMAGASAISGVASLRAPTGGLSGVGPEAAMAGVESAAASIAEHAATATPPPCSVRRRDDVLLDTRPSLFR